MFENEDLFDGFRSRMEPECLSVCHTFFARRSIKALNPQSAQSKRTRWNELPSKGSILRGHRIGESKNQLFDAEVDSRIRWHDVEGKDERCRPAR